MGGNQDSWEACQQEPGNTSVGTMPPKLKEESNSIPCSTTKSTRCPQGNHTFSPLQGCDDDKMEVVKTIHAALDFLKRRLKMTGK